MAAFQALGFTDVREVAIGADLCTVEEAKDFLEEVPEKLPFMATSCCPSWSMMAKKLFPEQAKCISMALTPMVLTARLIKQKEPDCKIVFVGPCAAKKLEASRKSIRSYVDFVLTFEEVAGMFDAKGVDWKDIPEGEPLFRASADGRGFAVSGGVAQAVVHAVNGSIRNGKSKWSMQKVCRTARRCSRWRKPVSTMAICWKEWHVLEDVWPEQVAAGGKESSSSAGKDER